MRDSIADIKSKLDADRAKLLASFADVVQDHMLRAEREGSWSIRDILAHVAIAERVNLRFAQMMVDKLEPDQVLEMMAEYPDYTGEFELDRFNAWMTERRRTLSLEEVMADLQAARAQTVAWLETLAPEQLERTGKHAVWGGVTVRAMIRMLGIHDRMHRAEVEKLKAALRSSG